MKNILIIDDDKDLRFLLKKFLTDSGFACLEAKSGDKALELLQTNEVDLVLCDFKLRNENGSEILVSIKELNAAIPVIIMTGYSNVRSAVEVMQLGAVDYLIKPLIPAEIISIINTILDDPDKGKSQALVERASFSLDEKQVNGDAYVLSPNKSFQEILKNINLVAPTNYSVIIYGESGSGKEAFAQEIHKRSKRSNKNFLAIDCGALSKELAGSALFGHEKGAFTGAISQKIGAFELAEGGTVFLDEIINLPYEIQISLLRVMQERKMRRVGGVKDIEIDVRIIVASNKKLWAAAQEGLFREDLFHRFNEFSIDVPPLRERKDDILFYADHFLKISNKELKKNVKGFTEAAINVLLEYQWPGNIRELKNIVKRSVLLTDTERMDVGVLPLEFAKISDAPLAAVSRNDQEGVNPPMTESETEYKIIIDVLKETSFDKKKTAKILKIDAKTLNAKMKKYADLKGYEIDVKKI